MRTIRNLADQSGRTYVYLADGEIGNQFMADAEAEGFTFPDGAKPTERSYSEIMAINHDYTINFVGANGRMAFQSGAGRVNGESLIRVDYGAYKRGESEYLYKV